MGIERSGLMSVVLDVDKEELMEFLENADDCCESIRDNPCGCEACSVWFWNKDDPKYLHVDEDGDEEWECPFEEMHSKLTNLLRKQA